MDIIEIEKAIVSEILQDKGRPLAWFGLVNDIKPEMFTSPKLGKAYELALGGNYDMFDVAEKSGLKSSEVVSMVIDYNGFLGLATVDGFIENYYKRAMEDIAKRSLDADDARLQIEGLLADRKKKSTSAMQLLGEYAQYTKERETLSEATGLLGASTGWSSLDKFNLGFPQNRLWIAGGFSGTGKTYFMLNLALNLAKQNKAIAIFSFEQGTAELIDRLIAIECLLAPKQLFGRLDKARDEERQRARKLVGLLIKHENLVIFDRAMKQEEIFAEMQKIDVDYMMVDYLQLMPSSQAKNYDAIRENAFALQRMTKEFGVGTLVLSQISNEAQLAGEDYEAFGFKGSGDIAQTADLAIRISRYKNEDKKMDSRYRLVVMKNRHGEQGFVDMEIKFPGGKIIDPNEKVDVESFFVDIAEIEKPINE
jgi:replicative DNA helicase